MFRIGVAIMINVWDYSDAEEVIIECVDGETIKGEITSIDDEEDSGLGEDGISIFTTDGRYLGIAQSEIGKIQEL